MPAAASSRIRLLSVCIILSYFASRNDLSQPDVTSKSLINLELPHPFGPRICKFVLLQTNTGSYHSKVFIRDPLKVQNRKNQFLLENY